jgi:hypothetical protein
VLTDCQRGPTTEDLEPILQVLTFCASGRIPPRVLASPQRNTRPPPEQLQPHPERAVTPLELSGSLFTGSRQHVWRDGPYGFLVVVPRAATSRFWPSSRTAKNSLTGSRLGGSCDS